MFSSGARSAIPFSGSNSSAWIEHNEMLPHDVIGMGAVETCSIPGRRLWPPPSDLAPFAYGLSLPERLIARSPRPVPRNSVPNTK